MDDFKVRAITHFVILSKDDDWDSVICKAASVAADIASSVSALGYAVQSLRLISNPFGEYLDTSSEDAVLAGVRRLQEILQGPGMPQDVRIRFSIGAARSLEELELVPALIRAGGDLANCCVNVPADDWGLPDPEWTAAAARVCVKLAHTTRLGEGNFNFTANFNGPNLCPYFPAGFTTAEEGAGVVLGFEFPAMLASVLEGLLIDEQTTIDPGEWRKAADAMVAAVHRHTDVILPHAREVCERSGVPFKGIDSSAAPSKDTTSYCRLYQLLGVSHFGAPGSVQVSSFLTLVFKSIKGAPLVGFSGLMLACLEDEGLAASAAAGHYDIRTLLMCSAVCGIGLDTVPIPGDASAASIAALMNDTGALAFRLNKPLTVRLFPVPGKVAGDITTFESSDLCNCAVFAIP